MSKVKKELTEYFTTIVLPELKKNNILIKQPSSGIFRMTYKLSIIEYYPSSGKYFNITKQVRGQLTEGSAEEILNLFTK